jgi:ABC-type glycerol-3-phosphate transport system substrate-binding protein
VEEDIKSHSEDVEGKPDKGSLQFLAGIVSVRALAVIFATAILAYAAVLGDRAVSREARHDRVTVIYWEKWTGYEGAVMRKVVDSFNASQDRIFVDYLSISGVDTKTMLATAGGDPPDIAGIWLDNVYQFADAGALSDLTRFAQDSGLNRDYYIHSIWDGLNYHDKLWALPSTPAWIALHVRPDLVPAKYNTPETFPKTIGEFDKFCNEVTKKGADGKLEVAGFLPSDPGWYHWPWPILWGGSLFDGRNLTINSPEALTAYTWLGSFSKRFGTQEVQSFQSGFANFASPDDPFMIGKVETELNGIWKGYYIQQYKKGLPFFAVPFPYPDNRPDLANHSYINEDVLTIPRGAKHAKEAFEFLRYVQRQDIMEMLCDGQGKNTPLAQVSEAFYKNHPNPYIRFFDKLAHSGLSISPPKIGIFPQIKSEMGVAFDEVNTGLKTPKQALDDAQNRLSDEWKTYQVQVLGGNP